MSGTRLIGAIVLAAGNSSRMGAAGPKQLLTYQGQSLVRRAIDTACMSAVGPIVVVLGANAEQVRPAVEGLGVEIVGNPHGWEAGMGSSASCAGLERALAVIPNLDAIVFMLCDQPLVTPEDIRGLIEAHLQTGKPLIASSYSGTLGVPALVGKECFDRVTALPDEAGAKALFLEGGGEVERVPTEVPCAAVDIDSPEDYEKLRRCCGMRRARGKWSLPADALVHIAQNFHRLHPEIILAAIFRHLPGHPEMERLRTVCRRIFHRHEEPRRNQAGIGGSCRLLYCITHRT